MHREAERVSTAANWWNRTPEEHRAEGLRCEVAIEARTAEILAECERRGAVLGSLDDLRIATSNGSQCQWLAWQGRSRELIERVRSGEHPCCGEPCDGGTGCTLLGGAIRWIEHFDGVDRDGFRAFTVREDCPVAMKNAARGEWYVDLMREIEAICGGLIDV